ncbi:MAG: DUF2851 family protein [Dehalococcoidia bacterium]|nr:DUF2851 family protein [Dehalococcoidia bacterium]
MDTITERSVSALWMSGRLSRFNDDSGHNIEVVCPGRVSTRGGCDFQDVVIKIDGEKTVGDVEVHVTSDLWRLHGHHRDAHYNGVILHVSMWQRGLLPVRLQDGRVLNTIILAQYIKSSSYLLRGISGSSTGRCPHLPGSGKKADLVIVEAGLARFEQKTVRFAQALQNGDPDQILYKGICRALGYAWNVKPFETLAEKVTVQMLRKCAAGNLRAKYELLLGAAGLADSPMSHVPNEAQPMRASDWATSSSRPLNHPALRIAGLCHLLHRHEKAGMVPGLVERLNNALPREAATVLDRSFTVEGVDSRVLIGTGRAREIVVNAVLPFMRAYGASTNDSMLAENARSIYAAYPSLSQNELTRYMGGLLGNQAYGACRQQGLLHIFHNWCRTRECVTCPIVTLRKPAPV